MDQCMGNYIYTRRSKERRMVCMTERQRENKNTRLRGCLPDKFVSVFRDRWNETYAIKVSVNTAIILRRMRLRMV